jgi:hypothetical protein
MTIVHVKFETNWQPRKLQAMLADIVIFLKQQGAKNPQSWVEGEEAPKPKMLTLECSECWEPGRPAAGSTRARRTWEAPAFTACPKCGQRETVGKVAVESPVAVGAGV